MMVFKKYFLCMNKNGINIPQSQFEALFLSSEHNEEHVKKFLSAFKEFAENIVYRTHRTLQQSMFAVFMECIKLWGVMYAEGNYDLRNEETCKKAHDIMKLFGEDATYLPLI